MNGAFNLGRDLSAAARPAPSTTEPQGAPPSAPAGHPLPELARVVVSHTEAAALRRLFARVRDRQVILPARAAPFDPAGSWVRARELLMPPITIEPITLAVFDEGAVQ